MFARLRSIAIAVVFGTATAGSLEAQAAVAPDSAVVRPAPAPGPTMSAAALALRAPADAPALDERQARADDAAKAAMTQSQTLMLVGGAMFLAGAIIGGDAGTIIMVGGAGIGLWGLYQYLQ